MLIYAKIKFTSQQKLVSFDTIYEEMFIPCTTIKNKLCLIIYNYFIIIDLNNMQIIYKQLLNPFIINNEQNTLLKGNFLYINNTLYFMGNLSKNGGIIINFNDLSYQYFTYGILKANLLKNNIGILTEFNEYLLLNNELQVQNKHTNICTKTIENIHDSYLINNYYIYFNINEECIILNEYFIEQQKYSFNKIHYTAIINNNLIIVDSEGIYQIENNKLKCILKQKIDNCAYYNNQYIITNDNEILLFNDKFELIHKNILLYTPVKIGIINEEYLWLLNYNGENYTIDLYDINKKELIITNIKLNLYYNILAAKKNGNIIQLLYLNMQNILTIINIVI